MLLFFHICSYIIPRKLWRFLRVLKNPRSHWRWWRWSTARMGPGLEAAVATKNAASLGTKKRHRHSRAMLRRPRWQDMTYLTKTTSFCLSKIEVSPKKSLSLPTIHPFSPAVLLVLGVYIFGVLDVVGNDKTWNCRVDKREVHAFSTRLNTSQKSATVFSSGMNLWHYLKKNCILKRQHF